MKRSASKVPSQRMPALALAVRLSRSARTDRGLPLSHSPFSAKTPSGGRKTASTNCTSDTFVSLTHDESARALPLLMRAAMTKQCPSTPGCRREKRNYYALPFPASFRCVALRHSTPYGTRITGDRSIKAPETEWHCIRAV